MTGAATALPIAAEDARRLSLRCGLRGTLREFWADAAAVGWLRHMAGLPDPADDPGGAAFAWHAEAGGGRLALDAPMLGVQVRGVDPVALAEGLEALGHLASAVTPEAMAEAEATGGAFEALLPAHLRRAVMTGVGHWPPGVSFAPAGAAAEARPLPLDADAHRQAQATLEVQDHRPVIPVRSRGPDA
ncbi:hypothetical protein C882_1242 [Caenispirillum salinarum AK4]|uniref:Uncharacterized protein n=1 Tax=Caenispirillum salinarum AK4 TaxID=1238182 RepID=K9HI00_9PROT|nr:hypothetical protein [Caenispirillum salinarum]EKV28241.1 hypothetical protein C882_1242 [Caenispirillum salinarum AK4]